MEFGQSIRAGCSRVTTELNGFSHLAGCEGRGLVIERVPGSEFSDGLPGVWVFSVRSWPRISWQYLFYLRGCWFQRQLADLGSPVSVFRKSVG